MSASFRAAVYHGDGRLILDDVPERSLEPNEIRLRPHAAGICGTDLHILHGDFPARPPVILGHEFAGEIVEVGSEVSHLAIGTQVSIEPHIYCRRCKACLDGREHLCRRRRGFGVHMNGGFAEEVVLPALNAHSMPDGLTSALGALAEPLGCCLHGVERAAIQQGDDVAVFGTGPIGLMLLRLVQRAGAARVIAVEPNEARRRTARSYGASYAFAPDQAAEQIKELTKGRGLDIAMEASGATAAFDQALELLGSGGRLVVFGVSAPDARTSLAPHQIFRDELTILGSLINPFTHRRALHLLPTLDLTGIVTHTFPLERISEAFEMASSGQALKVQITPNG